MASIKIKTIHDFITGEQIPDTGAEGNRQAVERYLVEEKGFLKTDIQVNIGMHLNISGESYASRIDLVVAILGKKIMAIKCTAGSLGSYEREIVSAARLLEIYQIPVAIVSDGQNAVVLDTISGKKKGEGLAVIPSRTRAEQLVKTCTFTAYPKERLKREKLIFRSYDIMNINRNHPSIGK